MKIYLDDERNPTTDKDWFIARNDNEFMGLMVLSVVYGVEVDEISFDHDLGESMNGLDCLKILVDTDIELEGKLLHKDLKYNFHTANPCGRENMRSYLESYLKQKESV